MSVLVNLMIKIMLMVGLGIGLKKKGVITEELQKGLSNLLMTAVLPLNIIASSRQEQTGSFLRGTIFVAVFAFLYYIGAIIVMTLLTKKMKLNQKCKNLMVTMAVFANTGFIGFPLVEELFGNSSIIYAVIYNLFYNLFFYTYGMSLLSSDGKANLKEILKMPVTIASFVSILFFLGQVHLPEAVQSTCQTVGAMTVPLSMIVIGCTIADIKLIEVMKDRYAYINTVLRLLVFPAISILVLKLLGYSGTVAGLCVLITGLPSGTLNVIVAQQQDCEPEFAAKPVVQSMVFMIVALPVLFWMIRGM